MSKIRIHIKSEQIADVIEIANKDAIHKIRNVLRLGAGDDLYAFDGQGSEYLCKISQLGKKVLVLDKVSLLKKSKQSKVKLTLAFPVDKDDKVSLILQKATELGVSEFIPFTSQRTQKIKIDQKKLDRWAKVIVEAVRQSERLWIPQIRDVANFKNLIRSNHELKLAGAITGGSLEKLLPKKFSDVFYIIGPVGDFSPQEYSELGENGFEFIKLSNYLLKVETAAIVGVGLINYLASG